MKRLTTGMVRNFAKRGGMGRYFIEMNDCNKGVSGVYDYFHGQGGGSPSRNSEISHALRRHLVRCQV